MARYRLKPLPPKARQALSALVAQAVAQNWGSDEVRARTRDILAQHKLVVRVQRRAKDALRAGGV